MTPAEEVCAVIASVVGGRNCDADSVPSNERDEFCLGVAADVVAALDAAGFTVAPG